VCGWQLHAHERAQLLTGAHVAGMLVEGRDRLMKEVCVRHFRLLQALITYSFQGTDTNPPYTS